MLYNHEWEKQQNQRQTVRQAKKPTKRNPSIGQKGPF